MTKQIFSALLVTAVATFASASGQAEGEKKEEAKMACQNNECKGKAACAGFGNASCAGHNECKGHGTKSAKTEKECKAKKGKWVKAEG